MVRPVTGSMMSVELVCVASVSICPELSKYTRFTSTAAEEYREGARASRGLVGVAEYGHFPFVGWCQSAAAAPTDRYRRPL